MTTRLCQVHAQSKDYILIPGTHPILSLHTYARDTCTHILKTSSLMTYTPIAGTHAILSLHAYARYTRRYTFKTDILANDPTSRIMIRKRTLPNTSKTTILSHYRIICAENPAIMPWNLWGEWISIFFFIMFPFFQNSRIRDEEDGLLLLWDSRL